MHKYLIPLLAGAAAFPSVADEEVTALDQVVVTATRSELETNRLPATAIVIDRSRIERFSGTGLPDLLRYHAGLDIARNGGPGSATSLFLRGTESNHVLVLVDGIEMNPGSIGGAALQHIPMESIERIEIIKGPRSALYGSEAIGGVINVITRRDGRDRLSIAATGGSFGTRELDAGYFGSNGNWHFGAELGRRESDGFPPRVGSDLDRGYERDQVNAYAGWRSEDLFIEARHWRAEGISEYLGFSLEPLAQEFENATSSLDLRYVHEETWGFRALLGNGSDATRQQQENFLGELDFVETNRNTADLKLDVFVIDDHVMSIGLYTEDTAVDSLASGTAFDISEDVNAIYLQDVFSGERNSFVTALRYSDYEAFGNETTWNFGWNRTIGDGSLFMSAGTAFRAPDATDRFGYGGNPDLDPETSRSIELGYRHAFSERHSLGVALFRNDIDELIAFVDPDGFEGPDPGANENIDEARIEGVELSHEWRGSNAYWRVEAIVQDPRDLAADSQLARRARRTLTASYVHQLGDFELGVDGLATGSRPDSPFNDDTLPGYGIIGASLRWFVTPSWTLGARIENVTDREYQTAAGYNSAERSYFVNLRYSR